MYPLLAYCLCFLTAFTFLFLYFLTAFTFLFLYFPSIIPWRLLHRLYTLAGLLGGMGMNSFFHFNSGDAEGNGELLVKNILCLLHKV